MVLLPAGQEKDSAELEMKSDILKNAEEALIEASAELVVNLRQMVNEPAFSDVEFACSDGERVHGSRILLAGRSDVLKSMLLNGMAESILSEITLPEISSPVLLSVFEFLYTGTLSEYYPRTWKISCEVIIASRFFLLPKLEMITRKYMHQITSNLCKDLSKAASLLTEAMEFEALRDKTDVSLRELVIILSSNWSDKSFASGLSEDAFHYLLTNSKGTCEDDSRLSFTEYLRFGQVIRWWVYQSDLGSPANEELLNFIAPDERRAVFICSNKDGFETVESTERLGNVSNYWSSLQLDKALRSSVSRLLSNIDYRWIHPVLLTTVVEPLQFASAAEILSAYRYHAYRRVMILEKVKCRWDHGESYTVSEQGCVVQRTGAKIGLAMALVEMGRSYGLYQWRFTYEELSEQFIELGFFYHASGTLTELDGDRLSDHYGARVLKCEEAQLVANWQGNEGGCVNWKMVHAAFHVGSTTLFTFDPVHRSCSLSIDDKYCGVVWENLPSEIYYPAVSLGTSSIGRIRIELVSGFDRL